VKQVEQEKLDVLAAGGLYVIGTERHESRRIDNQLRGRSGRQGDPGRTRFYLSLEDDLMRIFARDWVGNLLEKLGMTEGQEIQSGMVSRGIEKAQKRVESRNFEIRKNLLEYDEVMDIQRKEVYGLRQTLLEGDIEHQKAVLGRFIEQVVDEYVESVLGKAVPIADRDPERVAQWVMRHFGVEVKASDLDPQEPEEVRERLVEAVRGAWRQREAEEGEEAMRWIERFLLLDAIDARWKDHLHAMDGLKTGIGLRGYGQIDPKVAFKIEGHRMFGEMLRGIRQEVTEKFLKVRLTRRAEEQLLQRWSGAEAQAPDEFSTGVSAGGAPTEGGDGTPPPGFSGPVRPIRRKTPKVGRNDPCPCGSGLKYKKCHGRSED
jgi:preprotein translocase subunit SecA